MNILYLSPSLQRTDGWSRYAADVVSRVARQARVTVLCHEKTEGIDASVSQEVCLRDPLAYLFHPVWVLADAWRVRGIVRRLLRPGEQNIIHCTAEGYAMFLPFLRGLGTKMFFTVHGTYSVLPLLSWKTAWLYRRAYRAADRVIAVSHYTKRHLLASASGLLRADKIHVVTNGVDFADKPPHVDRGDGVFRILTVGEVKPRKGADHLVRVAALLRTQHRFPFIITLVGRYAEEKPYFHDLQRFIREHDLADCVRFAGMVTQEALDDFYRSADLFALLSVHEHGNYEGYPLVFHEAAMWGMPTIGTFDCGAEDAIKNGVTGILVHPERHEEVAEAIVKVRTGASGITPGACREWARENDWSRKDLMGMYAF